MNTRGRSIVPSGFQCTAHPIFAEYLPPCVEVKVAEDEFQTDAQKLNLDEEEADADFGDENNTIHEDHCSICLSPHTIPITLVSCCHSFCRDCALVWFRKKPLCPLCKSTAQHFVQSNNAVIVADQPAHQLVKIWAIYENIDELRNVPSIHRSVFDPAIRTHVKKFIPCASSPRNPIFITKDDSRNKRAADDFFKSSDLIGSALLCGEKCKRKCQRDEAPINISAVRKIVSTGIRCVVVSESKAVLCETVGGKIARIVGTAGVVASPEQWEERVQMIDNSIEAAERELEELQDNES